MIIWTIGHSTDPFEAFLQKLTAHGITLVADVRRFPGSKRHPHFSQSALADALQAAAIGYVHFPELGGRRRPRQDSHNTAWRLEAFRGYADYMETAEFAAGMERLLGAANERRAAIMCAERLWWSCHRALISDALKSLGHAVLHIRSDAPAEEHPYTSAARIVSGQLSYRGLL